ncbi:protein of unknown function [Halobacillus karajensis]|uniref:DUF4181 domain-containing protein n=1 Tax=Halobacillus karajensis TaxID=195088 RepID=A0A024PB81_9BACI|nr:DUF4181 domain-containing protein [Halobacillus karajensis]CDQ21258.1 hypothetical protein BN982_03624 [Halobacillus karajensis]CDQ25672.1 hypothetical protein BN983_04029 [Halobacillus karajensis]CDQ25943.1 hypothetical protein BN981_00150 [Halobacillus karajensis]SEI10129.1 protein of unknown function [Halobacillus karajensis]
MEFLALLILLIALMFVTEKVTNKILRVEKVKISETSGKPLDRWGRGIILLVFLCTLWFVIDFNSDALIKYYLMTYLAIILGFQAIMEFTFIKDSKHYVSTMIILLMSLIIMYNVDKFPFLEEM